MERVILHSDMNSFYASVEMMLNPALKGKAVAVCGSTENRHGIVLAKSELAKKAGVKTGMANWEARKACPDLIMVPPHYDQYLKYSELAHQIYYRYTDLVEPFGMDECWLDVTGSRTIGSGMEIAESIRQTIKSELGLTVSIGVSYNKIFAKLGSDMKKPDAITEITPDNFKEKVWPLQADEMIYVGRATFSKLSSYGIKTIGQLAATDPHYLQQWFGINGLKLWNYANGTDTSRVMHKDYEFPMKSIGHGTTCITDLSSKEEVANVILELSQDVGHRLKIHDMRATGVQISVKDQDFLYRQYQCPLSYATQNAADISENAIALFNSQYDWWKKVRAITVRAIGLIPQQMPQQLSFDMNINRIEKREKIDRAVEDIRRRFGKRSVIPCSLLQPSMMVKDDCDKVHMPGMMYV